MNQRRRSSELDTPDLQEILRMRREMLNRVRADLDKVDQLQKEFSGKTRKPENRDGKYGS